MASQKNKKTYRDLLFLFFLLLLSALAALFVKAVILAPGSQAKIVRNLPALSLQASSTEANTSQELFLPKAIEPESAPNVIDPSLIFGSFFDTFSSDSFINQDKTTLYQDKLAHAFFFPPDYSWQVADEKVVSQYQEEFSDFHASNFQGPYNDKYCLHGDCLGQTGNSLSFNGQPLAWPQEMQEANVKAVSIGALSTRWLVGFTIQDKDMYRGAIFYFDGQKFIPLIKDSQLASPYFGLLGFGGEDNDFLIVYGARQGIAYRIRGREAGNISKFFDFRAMNEGFKAEIIKTRNRETVNWYVFSKTKNKPWLIKLWQNGTNEIVGEMVFDNFFSSGSESAFFKFIGLNDNNFIILSKIRKNNKDYWRLFIDRGFKNEEPQEFVSAPIFHNGSKSILAIKKIALSRLEIDLPSTNKINLLFSTGQENWQLIPRGENIDFSSPEIQSFILKVNFPAESHKFYSPFLESILFDYYCQK